MSERCKELVIVGMQCQRDAHVDGFHEWQRGHIRITRPVWSSVPTHDPSQEEPELEFERQR